MHGPCAWHGSKVPAEAVSDGEDVTHSIGVGHCDEIYKDVLIVSCFVYNDQLANMHACRRFPLHMNHRN